MLIHYEWLELHRAGIAHTIIDVQVESPILTDDKIQQKAETLPTTKIYPYEAVTLAIIDSRK